MGNAQRTIYPKTSGKEELLKELEWEHLAVVLRAGRGSDKRENYGWSERWRWGDERGGYVGKQVACGGDWVQSNMCSCTVRERVITSRGYTCSGATVNCRDVCKVSRVKWIMCRMCSFVYVNETELLIYREKGYVPVFCFEVEKIIERYRSRCIIMDNCHCEIMCIGYLDDSSVCKHFYNEE